MRALTGKQASLLYLMTHEAFRNHRMDPWDALLEGMLERQRAGEDGARLREQMRPLRGIGREMRRLVLELHSKRPWSENLKWPERRLALFKERLARYYGQDGAQRRYLSTDEGVALHLLQWMMSLQTRRERLELGKRRMQYQR